MTNEIYYKVEGALYRTEGQDANPIAIDKTFEDENPIVAREKAFNHYQSYFDVLLQSKGAAYVSHIKAEADLQDFVKSGKKHKFFPEMVDMDGMSVNIYMVKKSPLAFQNAFGETDYQDTWRIHYIDNKHEDWSAYVLKSLMFEYSIYVKNGSACKNHLVVCDTIGYFKKRSIQPILKTPLFMG
jgi:hypothetical protein